MRTTPDRTKRPIQSQLNQSKTVVVVVVFCFVFGGSSGQTLKMTMYHSFLSFSFVTESCWEERTQYFKKRILLYICELCRAIKL